MTPSASGTARERARTQITAEILAAARARLTQAGPGELSLRAVARDVGMVSSAVYRYVASRDDLLTRLIVVAYDELGEAVESADAGVPDRGDHLGRWLAACSAYRTWALAHPGDWALLFGSPVPGYVAPESTIGPATRATAVLVGVVTDAHLAGATSPATPAGASDDLAVVLGDALAYVRAAGIDEVDPEVVARTVMGWSLVLGTVSMELFGHLVGSVSSTADWFDEVALRAAHDAGLATTGPAGTRAAR